MIEDIRKAFRGTADRLRANMAAAEYNRIVSGLSFVRYVSDTSQTRRDELTRHFADAADDYFLQAADSPLLVEELEDQDSQKEVITAGGDEPLPSRYRPQSRRGTRRYVLTRPARQSARRFVPANPCCEFLRLVARHSIGGEELKSDGVFKFQIKAKGIVCA